MGLGKLSGGIAMRENELRPLGEGCADPSSLEAKAGDFLRQAKPTTGLSDREIASIASRLSGPRPRTRAWRLVPALAIIFVCLLAGTVVALVGGWRLPFVGRPSVQDSPRSSEPRARKGRASPAASPVSLPTSPEPTLIASDPPATPPETRAVAPARRGPKHEPAEAPREAPAVQPSALSNEARSLADALTRWRRDDQAETALAMLAEHDRRFPRGALAIESRVARAEILLTLGRKAEALTVLDHLVLAGLPRARELHTLRGELRAQMGRCPEARVDLSTVINATAGDEFGRRAARALANCP
jgi:hypothetical protein